ncbi:MAG: zinc ribbon domain-containing protein [Candidatus Obscuribacterales bacterium]|nr:zinc ribbon domain-containing protein [Candidatus Obscuribacterales bacterium]
MANNEDADIKSKAAEEAVRRLEKSNPFSEDLANALEVYAWILRSQNRLLDAANMKAKAQAVRAKISPPPPPEPPPPKVIIKKYIGNESETARAFQADASKMSAHNYFPTSQVWAPGSYGCGMFLLALLLCFLLVGILIFIYMLLVKPSGYLTVTYELREPPLSVQAYPGNEKTCPRCAEQVKPAAKVCRFCGHNFEAEDGCQSSSF